MNQKVLVGMSGGVDSAVSAYLLLKNGFAPTGVNCKFIEKESTDIEDAKAVAEKIGIPFFVYDLTKEFEKTVIANFVNTYMRGETPNPCIVCNKQLKFGLLLDKAIEMGMDYIATGHYAQLERSESGRVLLKKGEDKNKDQSYVLYCLTQHQLAHTLFPLGGMNKTEIRAIAQSRQLVNAKKRDSQDICFVPDGKYAAFIENYVGKSFPSGDFVDINGKVLGTHKGIIRYTVGQRRGLGLALPAPLYVYKKDAEANRVILSDEQMLFSRHLDAKDINFIPFDKLEKPMRVKAKARYKQSEQWATVTQTQENRFHVEFDEPQRAFAKGQAVVLYSDEYVIGGGTII